MNRNSLNPYRHGLSVILRRLYWDLCYSSRIHAKKISNLKNKHKGKKVILLCNGPSLNKIDLESIKENRDIYVIGLNKINLIFNKTKLRPDMIIASNLLVIEQNKKFFENTKIKIYLDSKAFTKKKIKNKQHITYFHSSKIPGFAKDCSISINPSHTVTNTALQLIYHMGFKNVGIVGIDHNFSVTGEPNSYITGVKKDLSHFDENYFKDVKWQLPDLCESEVGYIRAKHAFEKDKRKIYNCSVGGKLEIFNRLSLKKFFSI